MYLISDDIFLQHEVAQGHPERPERLHSTINHLKACGLYKDATVLSAGRAGAEDILRAHPKAHLDYLVASQPESGVIPLDPDTWMGQHSLTAAYHAAGALCDAVDHIKEKSTKRVFCAVRPPGHHAEISAAMGFCLFNSVAIGALRAMTNGFKRVAILDFDVHHGNGTVDIFKDNPDVLVCSTFEHPHYPNRLFDIQRPNIINCPLAAGSGSTEFRHAIEQHWLPAIQQHQPDLIFISAGFDAHQLDPLASINLTELDFTWVTQQIVNMAERHSNGQIISTLEGGYHLDALATSVEAHLAALI